MFAYKLFQSGLNSQTVACFTDVAAALTATGTTQATAYSMTYDVNEFTTVASGTGAVLSSVAVAGDEQTIYNGGANALKVYPNSGAKINGLPTDTGILLAPNTACSFQKVSSTRWIGKLSA